MIFIYLQVHEMNYFITT